MDRVNHPKYAVTVANRRKSWMRVVDSANGPTRRTDWTTVNWRKAERIVRNLRQRIFRAAQAGKFLRGFRQWFA